MKKIVLSLAVVLLAACSSDDGGSSVAPVQKFKVTNGGVEITNGKVFEVNQLGEATAMYIQIENISDENLYFKLRAESGQNTDGVQVNFCFGGVCLFGFNAEQYVPPTIYDNLMIAPGETNLVDGPLGDKFYINENATISGTPAVFNFGLYQYNSADQDQTTGTRVLSFSYRYAPN